MMAALALVAGLTSATAEAAPHVAVLPAELLDMSGAATRNPSPDLQHRLDLVTAELRKLLAQSGEVEVVDVTPAAARIADEGPVYKCNGCEDDIAKSLGADWVATLLVQKTSNLILSFRVKIDDARSGKLVRAGLADIRGDTDDGWVRGVRWIVKNRLLDPPLPTEP
ncbi:DUF3280 domain-containing protein [Segnochrobactrum spirostomi]|uniref:DUF2380 domain-containing protein n=1 Tax=Segnochrobactrum spirostomi TaxID=2608987 RepID=A0A6A7YC58_9HYPH|nr:DUF3280 domain-containing protein [Segnochrobactrum spirostomi]MQT15571.1 DUF2380 domain-containing protein [Segnochrobactrum spirostomi]